MRNKKPQYRDKYTIHHKICSSRGGTGCKENTDRIKQSVHRSLHTIFDNQLPDEQLITITDLNRSVYTEEAKQIFNEALMKILSLKKEKNLYNKTCYKNLKT